MRTALYRHFAADGALLYVGISRMPSARLAAHMDGSHWAEQIARVEIEWFGSRVAAARAEYFAIQSEAPRHNIRHSATVSCDDLSSIAGLIDAWPTRKALAEKIGANPESVHKWAASNRIPSDWQAAVIRAAQAMGLAHVTGDWMVSHHERLERGAA